MEASFRRRFILGGGGGFILGRGGGGGGGGEPGRISHREDFARDVGTATSHLME